MATIQAIRGGVASCGVTNDGCTRTFAAPYKAADVIGVHSADNIGGFIQTLCVIAQGDSDCTPMP
jgi:hypothetical protein